MVHRLSRLIWRCMCCINCINSFRKVLRQRLTTYLYTAVCHSTKFTSYITPACTTSSQHDLTSSQHDMSWKAKVIRCTRYHKNKNKNPRPAYLWFSAAACAGFICWQNKWNCRVLNAAVQFFAGID